jgi:hypothetical protein
VLSFNICVDEFFIGIRGGIIRHIEYGMSGQTDHMVLNSLLRNGLGKYVEKIRQVAQLFESWRNEVD